MAQLGVVVAMTAVALAGCMSQASRQDDRTGCGTAGFVAPFDRVDPCDGLAVLRAAVGAVFAYDPGRQADPGEAVRWARPVLESRFADSAELSARVWGPITAAQWQRWRETRAGVHSSVGVGGDDHPPDTTSCLARVVAIEIRATGTADTVPVTFPAYATVTRAAPNQGWLLSGLQVLS